MFKIFILGLFMLSNNNAQNANRLIHEDSPYLLQHAHNLVDWYPWGDEAFEKAKREDKLIFLSIGYSTCHWCHVMEYESFENKEVAAMLKRDFVSVKVDREEYPHIDRHYQDIYVLMNRRAGGWPLTIVMTPEKGTFFSATYLPIDESYGRSGIKPVLQMLSNAYKERRDDVQKSVDSIKAAMQNVGRVHKQQKVSLDISIADDFVKKMASQYDAINKGFGNAPKFPHATALDTLVDIYRITDNKRAVTIATEVLMAMSKGGIYDQIEGGFYRYSVDEKWLIPHFEKMLYSNAELLESYANAYKVTKETRFKTVIEETIANINARFLKEGMFYSASDADSDGEEGKYFVFDYKESLADLRNGGLSAKEAEAVLDYYSIYPEGNFEHNQTNPYLSGLAVPKVLAKGKAILKANREKKNYPFIDYKVQTSWNGLYLYGLLKVAKYVDSVYAKEALASLDSVLKTLYVDGALYHQVIVGKKPKVKGYLEDYAFLIAALIEAYQVDFETKYLDIAKKLQERSVMKFYKNGIWYMSDDSFQAKAEFYDSSYRSALAVMIENLFKIAILSDNLSLDSFAKESLASELGAIKANPNQYPYGIKAYLQSLLSFVVVKSKKENLQKNREALNGIDYPYVLLKTTEDANFLACKIDTCFAIEQELGTIIQKVEERQ
ncbi:MAG: thioredoxin domain-containing protein [Epsilonproteobacteria bacterium]|nr:thioredoxin domain-containing protein [Campylobacterota bacterium]